MIANLFVILTFTKNYQAGTVTVQTWYCAAQNSCQAANLFLGKHTTNDQVVYVTTDDCADNHGPLMSAGSGREVITLEEFASWEQRIANGSYQQDDEMIEPGFRKVA